MAIRPHIKQRQHQQHFRARLFGDLSLMHQARQRAAGNARHQFHAFGDHLFRGGDDADTLFGRERQHFARMAAHRDAVDALGRRHARDVVFEAFIVDAAVGLERRDDSGYQTANFFVIHE